jgi:hypothetical protein
MGVILSEAKDLLSRVPSTTPRDQEEFLAQRRRDAEKTNPEEGFAWRQAPRRVSSSSSSLRLRASAREDSDSRAETNHL